MAEHGAHLTSSTVQDIDRPNIFEVLAQENLTTTIRPAVKHAVRVFAEKYPAQLGPLLRFYDEIFLTFDAIVQLHYLTKWDSSFAENFYDLTRCSSSNKDVLLTKSLRMRSLACLVMIPYVRQKLDSLFEDLRYTYGEIQWKSLWQSQLNLQQRSARLYLLLYPYIHSTWELITLLFQVVYTLKGGKWHSLNMYLSGTQLRRAQSSDINTTDSSSPVSNSAESSSVRLSQLLRKLMNGAGALLSTGLSVAVFFLQFLDWWYASDSSAPSLTALPTPNAPEKLQNDSVQEDCRICPLCHDQRTNSTALSVSGYVFCYTCINQYIRSHHCCPVTGFPATFEHIVKIYEQDL